MSNSFVCRTCLSFSNKIHDLRNTQLQDTFEKLTSKRITQETITRLKGKSSYLITPIDYFYNGTRDAPEALVKEDPVIEYDVKVKKIEIQEIDVRLNPAGVEALKTEPAFIEDEIVVKVEPEDMWLEEDIDIEGEITLFDSCVITKSDLMQYEEEYVDIENICINDKENLPNTKTNITKDKVHTAKGKLSKRTKTGTKKQIYTCDICDAVFILKSRIVRHLKTHSQVPYTCMLCYKTFLQERYLKEHIKVHTGEKPFICHQCGTRFTDKSSLNRHIKTHNINPGIKTHNCEICNKKFLRRPHLESHLITHSGLKPYKCDVCNHLFTQKGSLKGHMRIHTGEKTHYCSECNKGFYRKGHLHQHMIVHSGKRPFPCDRCARRFTTKRSFIHHICKIKVRPH